jgi:hypothetical protein
LVSLIGDLGTGIPIIGDVLAASRIGKIVSKAAPLILKGLKVGAIYGMTTGGIALIEKIASGEELTRDDLRNALNVFNGIRMLKHTGFKSPKTKTEVENFGDFKSSTGNKSVKLSQTAIDKISAAEPSKQMRVAKKELIAAHKAKYNDSLPDDKILELYDIPSTTTGKK